MYLIVEKLMVLPCLCEYGKLCKVVSYTILIDRSAMVIIIFLIIYLFCQAREVFGSTMHGSRSVWVKHTKAHHKGRAIKLLRPSECQMAGQVLHFLHVFHLKTALQACTLDPVFVDYKNSVSLLTI